MSSDPYAPDFDPQNEGDATAKNDSDGAALDTQGLAQFDELLAGSEANMSSGWGNTQELEPVRTQIVSANEAAAEAADALVSSAVEVRDADLPAMSAAGASLIQPADQAAPTSAAATSAAAAPVSSAPAASTPSEPVPSTPLGVLAGAAAAAGIATSATSQAEPSLPAVNSALGGGFLPAADDNLYQSLGEEFDFEEEGMSAGMKIGAVVASAAAILMGAIFLFGSGGDKDNTAKEQTSQTEDFSVPSAPNGADEDATGELDNAIVPPNDTAPSTDLPTQPIVPPAPNPPAPNPPAPGPGAPPANDGPGDTPVDGEGIPPGGGGGDVLPGPAPAPVPDPGANPNNSPDLNGEENKIVANITAHRLGMDTRDPRCKLEPLRVKDELNAAAYGHSQNMAFYRRVGLISEGGSPLQRAQSAGYEGDIVNGAYAQMRGTADEVFNRLKANPAYKAVFETCTTNDIGVGMYDPGDQDPYWTIFMGDN